MGQWEWQLTEAEVVARACTRDCAVLSDGIRRRVVLFVPHWRWWVLGPPASHLSVLAPMKPSYLPRVSWYCEFSRSGFLHLRLHSQCVPTLGMIDLNVLWIYYNILHKVRYICFSYRNHLKILCAKRDCVVEKKYSGKLQCSWSLHTANTKFLQNLF